MHFSLAFFLSLCISTRASPLHTSLEKSLHEARITPHGSSATRIGPGSPSNSIRTSLSGSSPSEKTTLQTSTATVGRNTATSTQPTTTPIRSNLTTTVPNSSTTDISSLLPLPPLSEPSCIDIKNATTKDCVIVGSDWFWKELSSDGDIGDSSSSASAGAPGQGSPSRASNTKATLSSPSPSSERKNTGKTARGEVYVGKGLSRRMPASDRHFSVCNHQVGSTVNGANAWVQSTTNVDAYDPVWSPPSFNVRRSIISHTQKDGRQVEHLFEFQIMTKFFAHMEGNVQNFCQLLGDFHSFEGSNIANDIDNAANLVYANPWINQAKLSVVSGNDPTGFGANPLRDAFNTHQSPQQAVERQLRIELLILSAASVPSYLSQNAARFRTVANKIVKRLETFDRRKHNRFEPRLAVSFAFFINSEVFRYDSRARDMARDLATRFIAKNPSVQIWANANAMHGAVNGLQATNLIPIMIPSPFPNCFSDRSPGYFQIGQQPAFQQASFLIHNGQSTSNGQSMRTMFRNLQGGVSYLKVDQFLQCKDTWEVRLSSNVPDGSAMLLKCQAVQGVPGRQVAPFIGQEIMQYCAVANDGDSVICADDARKVGNCAQYVNHANIHRMAWVPT